MGLTEAGQEYRRRRADFLVAQRALHEAIRAARAEGMTLRAIAALSGLSFARVYQLTRKKQ